MLRIALLTIAISFATLACDDTKSEDLGTVNCTSDSDCDSSSKCTDGECVPSSDTTTTTTTPFCHPGYQDCDGDVANGCEADLQEDPNNCGKCGNICQPANCSSGFCALSAYPGNAEDCAVDSSDFYWFNIKDEIFQKISKSGGDAVTIDAINHYIPHWARIAHNVWNEPYVYWTNKAEIKRTNKIDNQTTVLFASDANWAEHIATDDNYVYWTSCPYGNGGITVSRASKLGGQKSDILTSNACFRGLLVDQTHVFAFANEGIIKFSKSDSSISLLNQVMAGTGSYNKCFAADSEHIYAISDIDVVMIPKDGTTPAVIATLWGSQKCQHMVESGPYIYATIIDDESSTPDRGSIYRIPKYGGEYEVLATQQTHPHCVAVDNFNVYWTTSSSIRWLPK